MNRTEAKNRTTAQKISGGLTGLDSLIDDLFDAAFEDDFDQDEVERIINNVRKQSKVLKDAQRLIARIEAAME